MKKWLTVLCTVAIVTIIELNPMVSATQRNMTSLVGETKQTAQKFTDVLPGSAFYDAVQWAVAEGITKGTSETTFSPSSSCTRRHILTFIWRMMGSKTYPGVKSPFSDQSAEGDFGQAALWAYRNDLEAGYSSEKGGRKFQGGSVCTRKEAVVYLWKLAGAPETNVEIASQFSDVLADRSLSNRELAYAVSWAIQNNITNGTSQTTFSPNSSCTRGQIVTFLYRYSLNT